MAYYFFVGMIVATVLGIWLNYILYANNEKKKGIKNFLHSEQFLMFFIEIIIAVVGFGLTLNVTNRNEEQNAKDAVIVMLQQANDYTHDRVKWSVNYYESFEAGRVTWEELKVSNQVNYDYYDNILANEKILQYIDMNTYGHIMQYLLWSKDSEEKMILSDTSEVGFEYLKKRDEFLQKMLELINVAIEVMKEEITQEEASERCIEIRYARFILKTEEQKMGDN